MSLDTPGAMLPIVEVIWHDAGRIPPWMTKTAAIAAPLAVIHTVGFLLDRSPERWLLVGSYQERADVVGAIEQIPAQGIVSVKCLRNCEPFQAAGVV